MIATYYRFDMKALNTIHIIEFLNFKWVFLS